MSASETFVVVVYMSVKRESRSLCNVLSLGAADEPEAEGSSEIAVGVGVSSSSAVRQAAQVSETSGRLSRTGLRDYISPARSLYYNR